MTFPEVFPAILTGTRVRRDAWGARRAVCILPTPWGGNGEIFAMVDLANKGDVPPYPFSPKGDDLRADDWSACS